MPTNDIDPDRPFKLPRPHQLDELTPDHVVAVVLRLAMEICVLRDRLSAHERLLQQKALLSPEDIDRYSPPPKEASERQRASSELIEKVIEDLT